MTGLHTYVNTSHIGYNPRLLAGMNLVIKFAGTFKRVEIVRRGMNVLDENVLKDQRQLLIDRHVPICPGNAEEKVFKRSF